MKLNIYKSVCNSEFIEDPLGLILQTLLAPGRAQMYLVSGNKYYATFPTNAWHRLAISSIY